jgi:hypothetical protein
VEVNYKEIVEALQKKSEELTKRIDEAEVYICEIGK